MNEPKPAGIRANLWGQDQHVSPEENEGLLLAFSHKEVEAALVAIKGDTGPGPDGWPTSMLKAFWPAFRDLTIDICTGFPRGMVNISRLNYVILPLIPKVQGADSIKQFRPIALINAPFKICAKVVATQMSPVAHQVINKCQTTFICGWNILEGPVVLQEIVHEIKRTLQKAILLKLDSDKAYDRVNWDFLREVLLAKGFDAAWVQWILQLVSGARVSGHLKGVLGHLILGVSQLQYVNDTMLVFEPNTHNIATVKLILLAFEDMSDMKINFHKCEVIAMGMDETEGRRVADWLNCQNESGIWSDLLEAKYFPKGFFFEASARGSPF
ncbi:hypothetical protein D1007_33658 [Hordeum vulgare]|nr:hypothetical protein D1007_33658 [Hordeum vulgare]